MLYREVFMEENKTFIHPTALVYPNVEFGDNVYVGPYCIVG